MRQILFTAVLSLLLFSGNLSAQKAVHENCNLKGKVFDSQTGEGLAYSVVSIKGYRKYNTLTEADGSFSFRNLRPGKYKLLVSYVCYNKYSRTIELTKGKTKLINVSLKSKENLLGEVVITAQERPEKTSVSYITGDAIEHLQPTSFRDLLELVPGGKSRDPNMTSPNVMRLREASSRLDRNMQIASLGVGFQMDGMDIDNDVNMQRYAGSFKAGDYSFVGWGVDLRTIPIDEIKNVKIIRGIPSVEHGNVSGGLVQINRINTPTPFKMRFKADQYGQLYALSKGVRLDENNVLNFGADYLNSNYEPINTHTQYHRLTGSVRWNAKRKFEKAILKWSVNADFTGSFDKVKPNKDNKRQDDFFKSDYSQFSYGGRATLTFTGRSLLKNIKFQFSGKNEWDKITQERLDKGGHALPRTFEEGESWGVYADLYYLSHLEVDGRPTRFNTKLSAAFSANTGAFVHKLNIGADFTYNKNNGKGEIFDISKPPGDVFYRPRAFKDIPALERLGLYAENVETWTFGNDHMLSLTSGVRLSSMLNLDSKYLMHNKIYADPRFNLIYMSPLLGSDKQLRFNVAASIGMLTRMPTMSQLYPATKYVDCEQLSSVITQDHSVRSYYVTYKWNDTNFNLEPARNLKWELRAGAEYRGNKLSVTYYQEKMDNAFRMVRYWRQNKCKDYDLQAWWAKGYAYPDDLSDIPYVDDSYVSIYAYHGNGSKMRKKGVEFQFTSQRIRPIHTRLIVNGAWFKTEYSNTKPYYESHSIPTAKGRLWIARYDNRPDGYSRDLFQTNFMTDTQVPRIGLIFSTSFQCTWFTMRQRLRYDGTPTEYVDNFGVVHKFTEEDAKKYSVMLVNEDDINFRIHRIPFEMKVNLKVSKDIANFARASLFVNRLIHYAPDYDNGIVQMRRGWSAPYFGMEVKFTI